MIEAWKRYVSCETTPIVRASDGQGGAAHVDAVDGDAAALDVVETRHEVADGRLPEPVSPTTAVVVPAGTSKLTSSRRPAP